MGIIEPLLPQKSRGVERVDDRRVINGREALQETAPDATVLAGKVHDTDGIRAFVAARHAWVNFPAKANRKKTFACSRWIYRERNLVERFFNTLKQSGASQRVMTGEPTTISPPSNRPLSGSGSDRYEATSWKQLSFTQTPFLNCISLFLSASGQGKSSR